MLEMMSSYYNKIINKGVELWVRRLIGLVKKGLIIFGSEMIIREYRKYSDIDGYFPEYDWTFEHAEYSKFKNGNIKCPYEKRICGAGFIGEGKYKAKENGKNTDKYNIYRSMLQRCYDPKLHEKEPTYKECEVEDYLLNFQHMGEWIDENYYKVPGEKMCLDKDILCKGNKIYSRETCIFVPQRINNLFVKKDNGRGDSPIGVTPRPSGNYTVYCSDGYGKNICLGTYSTKKEAFQTYKEYKEKLIKDTIDSYEGKIPEPHYSKLKTAMYNYKVEITD